jgi:hypothetical protein
MFRRILHHCCREMQRRLRRREFLLVALFLLGDPLAAVHAQGSAAAEYEVKAAFLFNIAKYVDWPAQAVPPGTPIVIGIVGDDPFGPEIDRLVEGRRVNDRAIVVRRAVRLTELKKAHIVFISGSERDRAPQICRVAESWNAITVGDTPQTEPFTAINFGVERGRIVFTANLDAARRGGARISSKLLHLAKSVKGGPNGVVLR